MRSHRGADAPLGSTTSLLTLGQLIYQACMLIIQSDLNVHRLHCLVLPTLVLSFLGGRSSVKKPGHFVLPLLDCKVTSTHFL